ncbi:hypothetical protein ZHAS_00014993 [Anopheles sinensis]|uniref:Uncharacterized protein n=1 Tax=Anopheles sinensis TaxID=74873 RepID=A0A084W9U0_ANOSI|nr:hypothetical protein ZHAS_00014993 [Anopheles sinensis]
MNREKRNSQINLHKTSLLCWIGHGTYVNNELRKPSLMQFARKKLLPGAMAHYRVDRRSVPDVRAKTDPFAYLNQPPDALVASDNCTHAGRHCH